MDNKFLQVVIDAEQKNWCVRPFCTTCGARDFRAAVASIPNLQMSLESIDLQELLSHREWCDSLRVTAIDNRLSIDWDHIFSSWLPFARDHVDFADHVFFYLVSKLPCNQTIFTGWRDACIDLALKTRNTSLIETLVRILGLEAKKYNGLVETALELSVHSSLLRNALEKEKLAPSEDDIRREHKREVAGIHLFGAIRRNDVKAVRALTDKGALLTVTDDQGRTPIEYANSLGYIDLVSILESVQAQQVATSDVKKRWG